MLKNISFVLLFFTSVLSFGQYSTKELDKLWSEKKYMACYKQAAKDADRNKKESVPVLYQAMTLYYLQKDIKISSEIPNVVLKILELTSKMRSRNPDGKQLAPYKSMLHELQDSLFASGSVIYKKFIEYEIIPPEDITSEEIIIYEKAQKLRKEAEAIFNTMHKVFDSKNETWKTWYGQDNDYRFEGFVFPEYNNPIYRFCNTAKDADYLSQTAKELFYLTNLVRINPKLFHSTFIKAAIPELFSANGQASDYQLSLSKQLLEMPHPLPRLFPDSSFFKCANYCAKELEKSGKFDYEFSDGKDAHMRILEMTGFRINHQIIWTLDETSIDLIIAMLVDKGVPCLSQRRILLSQSRYAGFSQRTHQIFTRITVISFGAYRY